MAKPISTLPPPDQATPPLATSDGAAPSALATPTDEAPPTQPKKHPNRGMRKRVLGEGEGDYCIYEITPPDGPLPRGCLVPIPTVPRFVDTAKAVKWIRTESGDLLVGKQVMIFKTCEILSLQVTTKPQVVIQTKPKITVTKPEQAT